MEGRVAEDEALGATGRVRVAEDERIGRVACHYYCDGARDEVCVVGEGEPAGVAEGLELRLEDGECGCGVVFDVDKEGEGGGGVDGVDAAFLGLVVFAVFLLENPH